MWTLCATNESPNPLLLVMLKEMCTKERVLPITTTEFCDMYQVARYTELMAEKNIWPEETIYWLHPFLKEAAQKKYKHIENQRPYPEIQAEVAKKLIEVGIEVVRDEYIGKMFKPDIIIKDKKAAILIHANDIMNEEKRLRGAEYLKLLEAKDFKILYINGEDWNSWPEDKKKAKIKEIVTIVKEL